MLASKDNCLLSNILATGYQGSHSQSQSRFVGVFTNSQSDAEVVARGAFDPIWLSDFIFNNFSDACVYFAFP